MIRAQVPDTAAQQQDLLAEAADLKRQAALLNTPETFARCAKAERKALALEKEAERLRAARAASHTHYLLTLPRTLRLVGLAGVGFVALQPGAPVVALVQPEAVWPLGRWLALGASAAGGSAAGAVGYLPWAMLCHRVSAALVRRRPL